MKARIFLLFSIHLISISFINAQITIGSDLKPNHGAILDLKQHEPTVDNTTATKGIGIPRVNLTTPSALSDISDAAGLEVEHTGLVVYNLNKCLNKVGKDNGIYVWSGTEWHALNNNIVRSADVYELSDTRAGVTETYNYRMFGTAGIWMTENMRATHYSNGDPISIHNGTRQFTTPTYAYPSSTVAGWNTPITSYDENPKQGLLYNWIAATMYSGGKSASDQGQNTGSTPSGNEVETDTSLGTQDYRNYYVVQGICPDGWHVPSDREWNDLEREIYQNADKYSTYTKAEVTDWNSSDSWLPAWESDDTNYRGSSILDKGHGLAMQHPCNLTNTNYSLGTSIISKEGGFSVLLTGNVNSGSASSYGSSSFMWSSSSGGSNIGYARQWGQGDQKVARNRTYRDSYYSVRCKKNDLNP